MLSIKTEGLRELAASLQATIADTRKQVEDTMTHMGPIIVNMMRRQMAPHRYKGDLENSIEWSYNPSSRELRVGSSLMRGSFNALAILERGTGPNESVPFAPIAAWAAFRGIPAGPVWMSIKQGGTMAHPVTEPTIVRPEFQRSLNAGAKKLASDILVKALTFRKGMKV